MSEADNLKLPADVIKRLTQRSNAKGLLQLSAHLALL